MIMNQNNFAILLLASLPAVVYAQDGGISDPSSPSFVALWASVAGIGGLLFGCFLGYIFYRYRISVVKNQQQPLNDIIGTNTAQQPGMMYQPSFYDENSSMARAASGVSGAYDAGFTAGTGTGQPIEYQQ